MRTRRSSWVALLLALASAGACARGSTTEDDVLTGSDKAGTDPAAAGGDTSPDVRSPSPEPSIDAGSPESDAGDGGKTPAPSTYVNGSVNGTAIDAKEAFAVVRTSLGKVEAVVAGIHERSGFCADYAAGIDRANDDQLLLVLRSAGSASVGVGAYPIGKGAIEVEARLLAYDGACKNTIGGVNEWAQSGTITIGSIGTSTVTGSFDLVFGGAKVTGAFDAQRCTQPGAASFTCTK